MDVHDAAKHEFGREFLKTQELADFLGLSKRTIEDMRLKGTGPRFVRISPRAVRYRPSDVALWVEARVVASTSEPTAWAAEANLRGQR